MTYALNFDKEEISTRQIDYARVNFKPEQQMLIKTISNLVCEQIEIPELAMRCITWYALSDWQKMKDKPISEIANMEISEKLTTFKEIFNIGKVRLKEMLLYPKEQGELLLDIAFERAFKYYLQHIHKMQR
ncbi:unnamed protein product [marine sediment metagenome]|uniref:Uncharacterized protein n=1 Tax=marine sediment metagenome TaxID=412755 RepID=X1ADJ6_9ZZZZ